MNGRESYKQQFKNKIEIILTNNKYSEILKGFYYHMSSGNISSEGTKNGYLRVVSNFLNEINKDIKDIRLDDYNYYKSKYIDNSSSYQILIHSALKLFSEYLFESEKTENDYMKSSKRPKYKMSQESIEKRNNNYLNTEEIQELIDATVSGVGSKRARSFQNHWKERDIAIIMLFLNTGLRCSAIYKLDIDSIDFDKKNLITTEKGGTVRIIDLSDKMLDCLLNWINKRKLIINDDEPALFISNRKNRLKQESIAAIVAKYSKSISKNHIVQITPHKLRATYGTQVYNKGGKDAKLVQHLMGHANIATTMIYIRDDTNRTQIGSDIMEKITFA